MDDRLKFGLQQGALLAGAGMVVGAIAGIVGLLAADGPEAVANVIATCFLLLVVLLPGLLWFWTWASLDDPDYRHYRTLGGTIGLMLLAGLLGSVAATLLFTVPAVNLPVIFKGENNLDLRLALMERIFMSRAALVVVVTTVVAVALAFWAHRRVASRI